MAFGDLTSSDNLNALNNFLSDSSYLSGYGPSMADFRVFKKLEKIPSNDYPHVQRWYRHIASFDEKERSDWVEMPLPTEVAGEKTAITTNNNNDKNDDDDDVDLFGSDEDENAEAAKIREERLAAYAAKKSKKPALIAKSSVLFDVKPWDDETNMKELEQHVRSIAMEGLLWGASKLMPVGYGINKLQIMCVIEDDKVSIDLLTEKMQEFEDYVQSVDIAAFNKI